MGRKRRKRNNLKTNKRVSEVSSHIDVDAELDKALSFHRAGNLQQAEEGYRKILKANPQHTDVLHLLAQTYNNMGASFAGLGQFNKATNFCKQAIELDSHNYEAYNNLGNIYNELGQPEEALQAFQQALKLNPNIAGIHNNLGIVLKITGKIEEAIEAYKTAIEINPDYPYAYNNLGVAYAELRHFEEAIQAYQRAIKINPDYPEAHHNLGIVLEELGNFGDAFASYQVAIQLAPDKTILWINFANMCQFARPTNQSAQLKQDLINCLHVDGVEHQQIGKFVAAFLKASPAFREVIVASESKTSNEFLDYMLEDSQTNGLFSDDLITTLLPKVIIGDLTLEKLLTKVRNFLLNEIVENLDSGQFNFINTHFLNALASQCFLNEYVYALSEEEVLKVGIVKKHVESKVEKIELREKLLIGILSCYMPAYELDNAENVLLLGKQVGDSSFLDLLMLQIEEPLIELGIRRQIPATDEVPNRVSEKIKLQYEENPYPRWVNIHRYTPESFSSIIKKAFPHVNLNSFGKEQLAQVLVAGCGTGKHAIQTALRLEGSSITAIDLSLTSLAYAERKTRELELENIRYQQVDILDLRKWNATFDIIECVGVLHHMEDPFYGWQLLTDLLNPCGFMHIGLYSKLARKAIKKARNLIRDKGYSAAKTDIRRCRQEIISMKGDPINDICCQSSDFYALSSCRDLLFNFHEEYFTLLQIDGMLKELNLKFVGFEIRDNRIKKRYAEHFPEDLFADSLPNWHQYEQEYPDTFANMYQFWVKKDL